MTQLLDYAGEHLAPFKVPRYIEFIDSLPLTPSGKIAKRVLREGAATVDGERSYDRTEGRS